MKKTLTAVAVLGAFAGSALAADVTLYGLVDTGLNYKNTKTTSSQEQLRVDSTNSFSMKSGQSAGSRWGLKGQEDLGNGYKVGFVLESGFDSDTGALSEYSKTRDRIFGREANLYVVSDFGTLSFGRVGALTSGAGSYNLMKYTPFDSGWSSTATKANFWLGDRDRMDNTVTYVTPDFSGFKVYAQYSFQRTGSENAGNERLNDRYVAIGATYNNGPFSTALIVDSVLHSNDSKNDNDSLGVTLGASYDFEVVKLFAMGQYGKHETKMGFTTSDGANAYNHAIANDGDLPDLSATMTKDQGWKGYTLALGATAPVLGGTAMIQANYLDAETCGAAEGQIGDATVGEPRKFTLDKIEAKNWGIAAGYAYPFSKRTNVYAFASYSELKLSGSKAWFNASAKTKQSEVGLGLVHKF